MMNIILKLTKKSIFYFNGGSAAGSQGRRNGPGSEKATTDPALTGRPHRPTRREPSLRSLRVRVGASPLPRFPSETADSLLKYLG